MAERISRPIQGGLHKDCDLSLKLAKRPTKSRNTFGQVML